MPDQFIREHIEIIQESLDLILKRFSRIETSDDFVSSEDGVLILDSVAMRLQVVGESLKKIHKMDDSFLKRHDEINWDNIMRLRDIVSHHYDKVDHEIIFDICKNYLPGLKQTIEKMH